MSYVMRLPAKVGMDLLLRCMEKQREERAWGMWLMRYQYMDKQTFVPFSKFYSAATQPQSVSRRPAAEILEEIEQIRKQFSERG